MKIGHTTLKDTTSDQSLKNMAIAGLTAGIIEGVALEAANAANSATNATTLNTANTGLDQAICLTFNTSTLNTTTLNFN